MSCGLTYAQRAASRDQRQSQKRQKLQKSNSDAFAACSHLAFHIHEFPRAHTSLVCTWVLTLSCPMSHYFSEHLESLTTSTWGRTQGNKKTINSGTWPNVLNNLWLEMTISLPFGCPPCLPFSYPCFRSGLVGSKYNNLRLTHFFLKYQSQCLLKNTAYQTPGFSLLIWTSWGSVSLMLTLSLAFQAPWNKHQYNAGSCFIWTI